MVPSQGGKACCLYPAPLASGPSLFLTVPTLLPLLASPEVPGLAGQDFRGHGPSQQAEGPPAQPFLCWTCCFCVCVNGPRTAKSVDGDQGQACSLAWDLGRTKQVPSKPQA